MTASWSASRPVQNTAHPARLIVGLMLVALFCGASGGGIAPAGRAAPAAAMASADSRVLIVTSDSGAYCRTLSGAIDAHGALSREVSELKTQGDGLCDEGQIRRGINRLRRALLVLTHRSTPPDVQSPP